MYQIIHKSGLLRFILSGWLVDIRNLCLLKNNDGEIRKRLMDWPEWGLILPFPLLYGFQGQRIFQRITLIKDPVGIFAHVLSVVSISKLSFLPRLKHALSPSEKPACLVIVLRNPA